MVSVSRSLLLLLFMARGAAVNGAPAGEACKWLGEDMPLPLTVKTPQDITFKAAAERSYLIFNLMAGGRVAMQRGDYATAVEKWETLLRVPGIDPQVEQAVAPMLAEARRHAGHETPPSASSSSASSSSATVVATTAAPHPARAAEPAPTLNPYAKGTVTGTVTGVDSGGAASAVVWLRRLDGPNPAVAPAQGRFITQRDKSFLPHVLAVPVGTTVEFRNEDRIYHNVFSLNKPNDFDAGIRAAGTTYTRTFSAPGPVEILCNIHSTMSAYVVVVDTPLYARTRGSGTFTIHGVVPGRYELSVWHESASSIAHKKIVVPPGGMTGLSVAVQGDRRSPPFVPDKYGHKRQAHLGY